MLAIRRGLGLVFRAAAFIAVGLLVLSGVTGCSTVVAPKPARHLPRGAEYITRLAPANYGEEADDSKSLATGQVRGTFEGALPKQVSPFVQHDSRLDHVAALLALARVWDFEVPVSSLLNWYFWKEGCIHQFSGYATWSASGRDGYERLLGWLQAYAGDRVGVTEPTSYGIYQFENQDGGRVVMGLAVVFARRMLKMKPVPKRYEPGEQIELELQFVDDYSEPRFYMDQADGTVVEEPIPLLPAVTMSQGELIVRRPIFSLYFNAPAKKGRYFIEITAREPLSRASDPEARWRRSVLWLPIYVGVSEPPMPDDFIQYPDEDPPFEDFVPTILNAYNRMRTAQKLPPIQANTRLGHLAQDRSIDAGDAAVELPPDPDLAGKIVGIGLPANDYYQTQGRFERLSEYIKLSLLRPASRFRLMVKGSPWIGIGIAPKTSDLHRVEENAVIQYTVEPVPKLDGDALKTRFYSRLNSKHSGERRERHKRDSQLEQTAQKFADGVCSGTYDPKDTAKAWLLEDAEQRKGSRRGSIQFSHYRVSDQVIDQFREKIGDGGVSVGLGVCQGDLPGVPQATYVVLLYAGGTR